MYFLSHCGDGRGTSSALATQNLMGGEGGKHIDDCDHMHYFRLTKLARVRLLEDAKRWNLEEFKPCTRDEAVIIMQDAADDEFFLLPVSFARGHNLSGHPALRRVMAAEGGIVKGATQPDGRFANRSS